MIKISKQTSPLIMGVMNVTPDSYYPSSRINSVEEAVECAKRMVDEGADWIDIGAEATNPSLDIPDTEYTTERERLMPILEGVLSAVSIPVSVDTSKPEIMEEVVSCGVKMINDTRALQEEGAVDMVASLDVPVCLMHMSYPHGKTSAIEEPLENGNVVETILEFLKTRVDECVDAGISRDNILIDPGIGAGSFGKKPEHVLELLMQLDKFKALDLPILIGLSRKSFIGDLLGLPVEERLAASLAATVPAVFNGANIIRTHDVKETKHAVQMAARLMEFT